MALTVLFGACAAVAALIALTAVQLTTRTAALPLLERAADSLLEIDRYIAYAWPALVAGAAEGAPIPLAEFPVALQLNPGALDNGPEAVASAIAAATALLIYDDGVAVLSPSDLSAQPVTRSVTRGAAFDATVGRLTAGGHDIAVGALIISGGITLLLAGAAALQARGLWRFSAPALMLGLGAGAVWIAMAVVQSIFERRADMGLDPFASEMWMLAADAASMLVRNAAVVGIACTALLAAAAAGGVLLRAVEGSAEQHAASLR